MPSRLFPVAILILLALYSFLTGYGRASAVKPEGLKFSIRFSDGKTAFRQGETIRLELSFASTLPGKYVLNNASYDRSGRLEIDTFHVDPQTGVADPLRDYFQSGFFLHWGGGLSSTHELNEKPHLITAELNEWVRFDRPGRYRLYVTSGRIGLKCGTSAFPSASPCPVHGVSNLLEFEILPAEPAWQKQRLQEAVSLLDSSKDEKARRSACRTLRFLGSADAARELVRRFLDTDNQCSFEYYIGLIASPQREFILKEMETNLHAPERPISYGFIQILSSLAYFLKNPAPPPYPTGDEEKERLWQADAEARRTAYEETFKSYLSELAAAFPRKRGAARAVCLNTLLSYGARKELAEQLSLELPDLFLSLPPDEQYTWLEFRWKQIANPAMLPVLRQIYEKPTQVPWGIRDLALRRLYELAPDEGRRLILKEIESGRTRISAHVLALLPDERLPELDEVLVAQMEAIDSNRPHGELDIYSALLARYASDAIFPRLREVYADRVGKLECAIQTPLLAYFLRVDLDFGLHMLERALTMRETGCYSLQFAELARLYWHPEMEKIAVAHLNDSSVEMMAQAANVLGDYGSASAEQPLWDALERWHERYAGREEKLRADMKRSGDTSWPAARESALVQALGAARGWQTDAAKVKRIERLCITKDGRQEAANILKQLNDTVISITLNYMDDSIQNAYVAQYQLASLSALKEKLAQFPRGTRFTWGSTNGHDKAVEQLFSQLQQYLTEREMSLEK